MYEFDHMLNGTGSRQHHQNMIRQAQRESFARNIKPVATAKPKAFVPLRAILATVINLITG